MPSTFSPILRTELMATSEQVDTWGPKANANLQFVEAGIAGLQSITITDANYVLTSQFGQADESRHFIIVATGTLTAARKILAPPNYYKTYIVVNNTSGGFPVEISYRDVSNNPTGVAVSVPSGKSKIVFGDKTNFYEAVRAADGLQVSGTATLASLSVTGDSTLGDASGDAVTVNAGTVNMGASLGIGAFLYLDKTNTRVGINRATPSHTLDLLSASSSPVRLSTSASSNNVIVDTVSDGAKGISFTTSGAEKAKYNYSDSLAEHSFTNWNGSSQTNTLKVGISSLTYLGGKVWHAGNDGSGSGLDADLWRGATPPAGSVVGTSATQTLTNKTLTSPAISGGSVSGSSVSGGSMSGIISGAGLLLTGSPQFDTPESLNFHYLRREGGVPIYYVDRRGTVPDDESVGRVAFRGTDALDEYGRVDISKRDGGLGGRMRLYRRKDGTIQTAVDIQEDATYHYSPTVFSEAVTFAGGALGAINFSAVNKTDVYGPTSSSSIISIPGLSVSLVPNKNSSKVALFGQCSIGMNNSQCVVFLYRGETQLARVALTDGNEATLPNNGFCYVDTAPSAGVTYTYTVRVQKISGTSWRVNQDGNGSQSAASSLCAVELG